MADPSETDTSRIRSPAARGISRKPPEKAPSNSKGMCSVTVIAPSGSTRMSIVASGSDYSRAPAGSAGRPRKARSRKTPRRRIRSEVHYRRRVGFNLGFEERADAHPRHPGYQVGGDRLDGVVERKHRVVVDLTGDGDAVF